MLASGGGAFAGSVSEADLNRFASQSGFGSDDMYGRGPSGNAASAYSVEKSLFDAGNTSEAAAIAAQKAKEAAGTHHRHLPFYILSQGFSSCFNNLWVNFQRVLGLPRTWAHTCVFHVIRSPCHT
jgi:hypothetical protein